MKFHRFDIRDIVLVEPTRHGDHRGFFSETFRCDTLAASGIDAAFVLDNHAFSAAKGVLRGLHFQIPPRAQGKLVRCTRGAILDVAVDIREGSPTYGQNVAVELSAANWHQLWVPPGFAHGYVTLEENTEVIYKVTGAYDPAAERGAIWNDPDLNVPWPIAAGDAILSGKDQILPRIRDCERWF